MTMPNINKRIYSGLILAGVFALIILRAPLFLVCPTLMAIAAVAMLEFYFIIGQTGVPIFRNLGVACGMVLIGVSFCVHVFYNGARAAECELAVLCGSFAAVCIRQFPQKLNSRPINTIAGTLLGILYVPFLFNFFTKLGLSWGQNHFFSGAELTGRLLCGYLIVVVKSADVGAFLVGSRFGKHKLFPRLSPRKTWEGFLGGLLSGLAVSLMLFLICEGRFGHKTMNLADALLLGILLPLCGMIGDLIESLLKRAGGAKDTGAYIPGMGGLLDVLDSLLVSVPLFYFYVLWFLPSTT
ncbi:MAG: CDP-archaeol synthase [Kiritimatiellae bacterium]|nr:CDP-archaeol synthase [Kiritimatiellia bacterium]